MSTVGNRWLSPLRYPGGKGALAPFVGSLIASIAAGKRRPPTYVEPFAGGAGVALRLLFDEYVDDVIVNDLHPGVAAFWRCVFHRTDDLVRRIDTAVVTLATWHQQHAVAVSGDHCGDDLELGFATFFLNRTNRSGILGARPIGGLEQQGPWTIDARFNKQDLVHRIRVISRYRNRVTVRQSDGIDLLYDLQPRWDQLFVYADPPYLDKSKDLYLDTLSWEDHLRLAACLGTNDGAWMVTYNTDPRVPRDLYPGYRCAEFGISHHASQQHMGSEYAVFSPRVDVEDMVGVGSGTARWLAPQR